ncbi:hypothetical protein LTR37_009193 [Vermiconidia calcicola]|uniref:Uncharacterized protein n=1 Tax=Vermiconidia calcicola TaxID=1690605 RepID=A0ACC3N8I1_9PEZI|nr:hypothetical protein LTR37_009193 [Vermiconidia calcicola]
MPRPNWSTILVTACCWSTASFAQETTTPATTTVAPSSAAASAPAASASASGTGNVTIDAVFRHWTGCTATEQYAIIDALDEASQILRSPGAREFDTKFYNHMNAVEYFGSPRDMKQLNQRGLLQEVRILGRPQAAVSDMP